MRPRLLVPTVLLASLAAPVWAAESPYPSLGSILSVGSRVRLRSEVVGGEHRGLIVALDDHAVTLAGDGGGVPLKLPLGSITAAETSIGRKRHTLRGVAIGAAVGLALGATYAVDPQDCGPDSSHFCSRSEALAAGSLGGAGLGALVGALVKTDRWAPITLKAAGPPGGPRGRSMGLAVAVRF